MNRTGFHRRTRLTSVGLLAGGLVLLSLTTLDAADRIVLRNLKVLTDRTVVRFDDDGVRLDDGSLLGWDEIERGKIADSRQAEFDRFLRELGEPLYRIRQRLSVGDFRGLLPHAEAVYSRYADGESPTAYMVIQSLMWARLASGRREESLEPYLRSVEYLRRNPTTGVSLPGERRADFDPVTGLSPELLPVWFDEAAARKAVPSVFSAVGRMRKPRPEGVNLYFATLALCAGQEDAAVRALGAMTGNSPALSQLREVVDAQRELRAGRAGEAVKRLEPRWSQFDEISKPLALYWLGVARTRSQDANERQQGLLYFLRIPAFYAQRQPDLAAAALFESMQTLSQLGDLRGSISVRKELLDRYAQTSFAARAATNRNSDSDATTAPATQKEKP